MRTEAVAIKAPINSTMGLNLSLAETRPTPSTNLSLWMESANLDVQRASGAAGHPSDARHLSATNAFISDVVEVPMNALCYISSKVDITFICAEFGFLVIIASLVSRFHLSRSAQFHALKLAAMHSGLSLYECLGVTTAALALLAFDIFGATIEEDLMDSAAAAVLFFALASIFGVMLSLNIFFVYALTPVSGGEQLRRILVSDIMNFGLTILRVMLCWTRYIFYDLQVELVDLSLQYTDEVEGQGLG